MVEGRYHQRKKCEAFWQLIMDLKVPNQIYYWFNLRRRRKKLEPISCMEPFFYGGVIGHQGEVAAHWLLSALWDNVVSTGRALVVMCVGLRYPIYSMAVWPRFRYLFHGLKWKSPHLCYILYVKYDDDDYYYYVGLPSYNKLIYCLGLLPVVLDAFVEGPKLTLPEEKKNFFAKLSWVYEKAQTGHAGESLEPRVEVSVWGTARGILHP